MWCPVCEDGGMEHDSSSVRGLPRLFRPAIGFSSNCSPVLQVSKILLSLPSLVPGAIHARECIGHGDGVLCVCFNRHNSKMIPSGLSYDAFGLVLFSLCSLYLPTYTAFLADFLSNGSVDNTPQCYTEPTIVKNLSKQTWLGTLRLLFLCVCVQVSF